MGARSENHSNNTSKRKAFLWNWRYLERNQPTITHHSDNIRRLIKVRDSDLLAGLNFWFQTTLQWTKGFAVLAIHRHRKSYLPSIVTGNLTTRSSWSQNQSLPTFIRVNIRYQIIRKIAKIAPWWVWWISYGLSQSAFPGGPSNMSRATWNEDLCAAIVRSSAAALFYWFAGARTLTAHFDQERVHPKGIALPVRCKYYISPAKRRLN